MNQKKWFEDALLINRDPNWYREMPTTGIDTATEESARTSMQKFFDSFAGYGITDVQLCILENTSIIPSEAYMWRGAKFLQKMENNIPVSYPEMEGLYKFYRVYRMDPVQMFLDTMNKNGIRPWLTVRMNDAHFNTDDTAFLRDDFFYKARENGWMIGERYGYYAHCLDYAKEPVRERMLSYIREVVNKYDMFGLELDFMREIYSFDYMNTPDRHAIMNNFIREVHEILTKAGEGRGHQLRLMIRTHRAVEDAYEYGFDLGLWAKNGWIDAVVPSPRWECTDDAIPVAQWKALVGEEIAVFPCIEILNRRDCENQFTVTSTESAKAYAAAWNAEGADGLYFYNHDYPMIPRNQQAYMLHRDEVLNGTRRYIVTYQDIVSGSNPQYKPLPMEIKDQKTLSMNVGPIGADSKASLILEFEGEVLPVITCNGVRLGDSTLCAPAQGTREADGITMVDLTGEKTYCYDCAGVVTDGHLYVSFHGKGVVRYLEMRIENQEENR